MSYIQYNKAILGNLGFVTDHEIIETNKKGAYFSSTLSLCNTRKYHGLLVGYQPLLDDHRYVFLSSLDESICRENTSIQLGMHQYPDVYHPLGYLHMEEFMYDRIPQWIIKADDVILQKEIMLSQEEETIYIRYTILEAQSPFTMQFNPFLSCRNVHSLGKAHNKITKKTNPIPQGISIKMVQELSNVYMQFSSAVEFTNHAEWNYNHLYSQEKQRGYDYSEDLYCPGMFSLSAKKGDQFIFAAGLTEADPKKLRAQFITQLKKHPLQNNFQACLKKSAKQFIIQNKQESEIIAGFHWFGSWSRDTFIALPGLTLATGQPQICKAVLDTMLNYSKNGQFPNTGKGLNARYNSVDASLWFFWTLQQYTNYTGSIQKVWAEYGEQIKKILNAYTKELPSDMLPSAHRTHLTEEGLLYARESELAITWMDAMVDGKSVNPRNGYIVEVNALWYNAIRFALEAAVEGKDYAFIAEWENIALLIEDSFTKYFWSEEKGYLADYITHNQADWSIRPNQLLAISLPYSPLDYIKQKSILKTMISKLLTSRGLRTLAEEDIHYIGSYEGSQKERDKAYHQGTVWPWLMGPLADAYKKVFPEQAEGFLKSLLQNFEPALFEYGLGSIAEIYEGREPHKAVGSISQAWSVSELLRIQAMIEDIQEKNKEHKTSEIMPLDM